MFTMRNSVLVVLIAMVTMPLLGMFTVKVVKSEDFAKNRAASSQLVNDQPNQKWNGFMISKNSLKAIEDSKRKRKIEVQLKAEVQNITVGMQSLSVKQEASSKKTFGFKRYIASLIPQDQRQVLVAVEALANLRISKKPSNK